MAKTPTPPVPGTAATNPLFAIRKGVPLPTSSRGFGKGNGDADPYPWDAMELGDSFIVPVEVDASITDDAEKEKAWKEAARKLSNSLSGKIRNRRKKTPAVNYVSRTVPGEGVGVWRVEPEAVPVAPPVPAAPAPPTA